ncbi:hypothetical protein H2204_007547 [Knufia peltigerae]|uniref:Uncharacterized protein n=1 Tax=Knufia peltigerae TaxID=1002370 RepID=A0AA38Y1X2_9EURO|nr:hypothetical protein H2204_007547 [Knufia peltigerae]
MTTTQRPSSGEVEETKRPRGKDLTPYLRAKTIGARSVGASYGKIAKALDLPVTTVRTTIKMAD